jgi:hypothetical protein
MSDLRTFRVFVEETITAEITLKSADSKAADGEAMSLLIRHPERFDYIGSVCKVLKVEEVQS